MVLLMMLISMSCRTLTITRTQSMQAPWVGKMNSDSNWYLNRKGSGTMLDCWHAVIVDVSDTRE